MGRPRSKHSTAYVDFEAIANDPEACAAVLPILAELDRRLSHPYYSYRPDDHPKRNQRAFHESPALIRLMYGGNQSGKSRAVAQEVAWWLTEAHPYQYTPRAPRIYVLSASYRTIQEGVYRHLKAILPEWEIEATGPVVPGPWSIPSWIRMKNGAQVDFISGEGKEDARRKVQAAEIDLSVVDEEVDLLLWEELQMRGITRGGRTVVAATLVRSEEWCTALEDRAEAGDAEVFLVRLDTYIARDRGHVSGRAIKELELSLPESEKLVRLHGQSRRGETRVYPEFGPDHVCDPFPIPRDWTRYCAIDPGWNTFACLWAAVAPDGKYVIYREIYEHAAHYRTIANMWYAAMGYNPSPERNDVWFFDPDKTEKVEITWIDPSAFGHTEAGEEKVGNLLVRDCGLELAPARNGIEAGLEVCRGALIPGMDQKPRMQVFRTCKHFLKEAVAYRRPRDTRDPNKAEKTTKPIKRKDHLMDAWRYMALGGLDYVHPPDPMFQRPREADVAPLIRASPSMDDLLKENWQRLMRLQKRGREPVPHVGGIGTEY